MEVDTGRTTVNQKMESWPECFQDLRSWCPPDRDELNTPQITMQDEFNFSLEGQVNCNNNWGLVENHPVEFISDSWVNNDLHLASPINDEENNNYPVEYINSHTTSIMKTEMLENVDKSADYNGLVAGTASSNVLKTKGNILLSQATLEQEDSPSYGEGMVFTDYIKLNSSSQSARLGSGGKIIKFEEPEEFHTPIVEPTLTALPTVQHQLQNIGTQRRQMTDTKRPRPPKLAISQEPPTTNESTTGTLSTPEVLKSLTDFPNAEFDILKFVMEGLGSTGKSPHINVKKNDTSPVQDHDYVDPPKMLVVDDIYIKTEPLSPQPIVGVKRHLPVDESDFDSDDPSNLMDDDDDSESEEWSPEGKQSRKSTGKRRGRKPSSVDSFDGQDKYRALRDRNNEASRRSRLNRKQRDMEMKKQESDLARKNVELKVKADRMENLVKEMRAALLKSVKNSRNCSS